MDMKLPESITPFLVPKESKAEEFLKSPCPMCDAIGALKPVLQATMTCEFEGKEEEVDVSGIICSECEEIFLNEKSLEIYLNTLLKLQGVTSKRYSLDSGQPVVQSIH